VELKKNPS